MSRHGNCLNNAIAKGFFSTLKKLRVQKELYPTRDDARVDVFGFYWVVS